MYFTNVLTSGKVHLEGIKWITVHRSVYYFIFYCNKTYLTYRNSKTMIIVIIRFTEK